MRLNDVSIAQIPQTEFDVFHLEKTKNRGLNVDVVKRRSK